MPTPVVYISLDGRDVTSAWASVIESVSVTDEAGTKSDTCEISVDNREFFSAPPIGARIQVWLGYDPMPVYMGAYIVDSWTKALMPKRLTVSGKAADLTGDWKSQKTRSHHQQTVQQIVNKIAGEHGVSAQIDARVGATMIEHIDQQTESDLHFLTRLAKRNGAVFKLADGQAIFSAKGSTIKPGGGRKARVAITPVMVTSCTVTASERGGYGSASADYMDHVDGKRKTATAGTPSDNRARYRDKRLYGTKEEAEVAAKADLGDLTRGKRSGSAEMPGNPYLYAECIVELVGFDPDMDGEYLAKSVTHTFGGNGYTTSLSFETQGEADD